MPSLMYLPLAPSMTRPPATDSGAGLQDIPPPLTLPNMVGLALVRQDATIGVPLDPFVSALAPTILEWNASYYQPPASKAEQAMGPIMLEWNALHDQPPAPEAAQAKEVVQLIKKVPSLDDELPGLVSPFDDKKRTVMLLRRAGEWPPCDDLVMPGTGPRLLTFSMDQLHAALDTRPQMFETAIDKEKKEEKKKEEDEHAGHNVALDGQGKDADKEEEKGGDPDITA